ncbi:dockerin type I domain-containing protein [Rosistilla oblonga]|uniref:dockerin type I domain-containing protein n=1 Tax=Rosistilla oblonga TaxID=2527990 RepID=UPI003A98048B
MARIWDQWFGRRKFAEQANRRRYKTRRRCRVEMLDKRQLLAANIFHNELIPEDVNEDGIVTAVDALTILNQMNRQSSNDGDGQTASGPGRKTDVNNDGQQSPIDALMVINRLNRRDDGGNTFDRPDNSVDQPTDETTPEEEEDEESTPTTDESGDVVLQWNDLFGELLADSVENQNPGYASRSMAMLNLAIYDAVAIGENGSDAETFYEYDLSVATDDITTEVAASQAAYTVLSSLYPDQQATLDVFLETSLAGYENDANFSDSLTLGTEIGNQILANRADDGSDTVVDYTYSDAVGSFQADPLNPDVPVWGPAWGEVDTFAIDSTDAFLPESTPALTSEEYAASYNEVQELGAFDNTTRTAEQTEIGIFWAYDREGLGTPLAIYNDVLLTVAAQEGNTLEENAALFAQASVAMADAAIVAWDTKFTEEFWRPVTAIQSGDLDGNALTAGDPDWTALGAPDGGDDEIGFTPQFPTYISGHATFGGALFGTLQEFYGTDDIAFELTSEELEILLEDPELQEAYGLDLDDATRSFSSFSEAMAENGRSRVYLGIHFDFDDLVGQDVGQAVAASVASAFDTDSTDDDDPQWVDFDRDPGTNNQGGGNNNGQSQDELERQKSRNSRLAAVDSIFANNLL